MNELTPKLIELLKGRTTNNPSNNESHYTIHGRVDNLYENHFKVDNEKFDIPYLYIEELITQDEACIHFNNCKFNTVIFSDIYTLKQANNFRSNRDKGKSKIELKFLQCRIKNLSIIGDYKLVHITDCHISKLRAEGVIKTLNIEGPASLIKHIQILYSSINNTIVSYQKINKLEIIRNAQDSKESNQEHNIKLQNLVINDLNFHNLNTGKGIVLDGISPINEINSKIYISKSNLSNISFYNCDFSKFQSVNFEDSKIEILNSNFCKWFKKIETWRHKIIEYKERSEFSVRKELVEDISTYRQFKSALNLQHDYFGVLYFRSMEFNAYLRNITFKDEPWEWLLLTANKISNNHGLSWSRGFRFTFIVTIITFLIYLITLPNYPYEFGWTSFPILINAVSDFIKYLCQFFVITHSFNFLEIAKPSGLSYFVDLLSRIVISYGIYQTVQAFRKYGK